MHSPNCQGPATRDDEIESLKPFKPFPQIAKLIEPGRDGRPIHVSTLGRWRDPGVRARDGSRIRLRCVRFPSGWRTSVEAVHEFIAAITADRAGEPEAVVPTRTTAQRRRELDNVDAELERAGIKTPTGKPLPPRRLDGRG